MADRCDVLVNGPRGAFAVACRKSSTLAQLKQGIGQS